MGDDWIKVEEFHPGEPRRRKGFVKVCELPAPLGSVTKLAVKNGRVVAETESGVDFIVPGIPKQPA